MNRNNYKLTIYKLKTNKPHITKTAKELERIKNNPNNYYYKYNLYYNSSNKQTLYYNKNTRKYQKYYNKKETNNQFIKTEPLNNFIIIKNFIKTNFNNFYKYELLRIKQPTGNYNHYLIYKNIFL